MQGLHILDTKDPKLRMYRIYNKNLRSVSIFEVNTCYHRPWHTSSNGRPGSPAMQRWQMPRSMPRLCFGAFRKLRVRWAIFVKYSQSPLLATRTAHIRCPWTSMPKSPSVWSLEVLNKQLYEAVQVGRILRIVIAVHEPQEEPRSKRTAFRIHKHRLLF